MAPFDLIHFMVIKIKSTIENDRDEVHGGIDFARNAAK